MKKKMYVSIPLDSNFEIHRHSSKKLVIKTPWKRIKNVLFLTKETMVKIYNTYLLMRYGMRKTLFKNYCPFRLMNPFNTLLFDAKIVSHPNFMKSVLKHFRKDPDEGFFNDEDNSKVLFPIIKDLFPSEVITHEDLMATCSKKMANKYRLPLLQYLSPQNIKRHKLELEKIVEETISFWEEKTREKKINVTNLSMLYVTTVSCQLLLGHPGPIEVYQEIGLAVNQLLKYSVQKVWKKKMPKNEAEKYQKSIQIMRIAINYALTINAPFGSLVDILRKEKLTELQIKTTLFFVFFGGAETPSSALNYLLWQLGKHPNYQEEIYQEITKIEGSLYEKATHSQKIDALFKESLRLLPPVYMISRKPVTDLTYTVKNNKGEILCTDTIFKDQTLYLSPMFAALNPSQYENPETFNPHRFHDNSQGLSWLPFGEGKHLCPGQWLAKDEISLLVAALVEKYRFESMPKDSIEQVAFTSLKTKEDVFLQLIPRI